QSYDRKLARSFSTLDLRNPRDLWPQFIALGSFPTLVIRGSHSDLLTAETVDQMVERHPNLRTLTVQGQGHAPVLNEPETVEAIGTFFASNDEASLPLVAVAWGMRVGLGKRAGGRAVIGLDDL